MRAPTGEFAVRIVVAVALVALAALLWRLVVVVVPIFAGMTLAVILRSVTRLVMRLTPLRAVPALLAAMLALLVLLGLIGLLIGSLAAKQFGQLATTLPIAWEHLVARVEHTAAGRMIVSTLLSESSAGQWLPRIQAAATITFGALIDAVLIIFTGVFLAADPELYKRGFLLLIPRRGRPATGRAIDAASSALSHWLKGVLVLMLSVGVIIGLGLWLLGIPLALTLGMLSGLMEFVPYVGPAFAALPAVLVAFSLGPIHAAEVIALYVGVHLIEGNLLVPLIQRWAVKLPPALGIVAVVIFGQLFGLIGIIFATPMTVVAITLIDTLYVRTAESDTG